jgi:hypothetical protein
MSVESPLAVRSPGFPLATLPQSDRDVDSSFDARWTAWIQRGHQHDLVVRRRMRVVLLAAVVIGILAALVVGITAGLR